MNGRQAMGAGLAATLTVGAAWLGISAATADNQQGASGSDRQEFRGWQGKPASAMARARIADGTNTLTVVAEVDREVEVDIGDAGESTGDFFVTEQTVYQSGGGKVIGEDVVRCELGIRTFNCEATLKLDGRGKIRVAGAFFGARDNAVPITGGTGNFSGVGGQLKVFNLRGGRELLVLELER